MELLFNISSKMILSAGASKNIGEYLKSGGVRKVLFICDSNLVQLGLTKTATDSIAAEGMDIVVFDKVVGEPSYKIVEEAVALGRKNRVDAIVGMGGGSAMDTAKSTMISIENGSILRFADTFDQVPRKGMFLMLIPTTFGTGSEVTDGAVISVPEENKKVTIWGKNTGADIAIIDPELALGLPPSITASTGMDALSHAVEAYTSQGASVLSDMMALKAIEIILEWLPKCVESGNNIEHRENMCLGSVLAGIAFNNGGLNQGHELAHGLGAKFHISHGAACALSLPLAIRANAEFMPERIKRLAELFGTDTENCSPAEIEDRLVAEIVSMRKTLGIPGFKEFGVTEDKLQLLGDAWDAEPKGEYPFAPDRDYIIEFVKSMY